MAKVFGECLLARRFPCLPTVFEICLGKSNLMDALSFVMGEKTQTLRVKRLSDLVHTGPDGNPVSQHALVRAIFEVGDLETTFERMVQNSSSVNRVNGKVS